VGLLAGTCSPQFRASTAEVPFPAAAAAFKGHQVQAGQRGNKEVRDAIVDARQFAETTADSSYLNDDLTALVVTTQKPGKGHYEIYVSSRDGLRRS